LVLDRLVLEAQMKLHQLRYLGEIVAQRFNITAAAAALHTSQSGISRQVRLLEEELNATLLVRRGNRILGLTEAGREIALAAQQVLVGTRELKELAAAFEDGSQGGLTVATTHVHARYALLPTVSAFSRKYPTTSLRLVETVPAEIVEMVLGGRADIGITTEATEYPHQLAKLPVYDLARCLVTAPRHPLLKLARPSLEDIAKHPLIVYDQKLSSGWIVTQALKQRGITPKIVLTATEADVVKAYVAAGVGVAVIQSMAYDRKADPGLRAVPLDHIFPASKAHIVLRRGKHLRPYMHAFIEMVWPEWTPAKVKRELGRELAQ
jgi:LysR family cys regulon transcriptional activator